MTYPNEPFWRALGSGPADVGDGRTFVLSVVDCGTLRLPTGKLMVCDPFVSLGSQGDLAVPVPPGDYAVKVTLADVSKKSDGSHMREAYASVLLDEAASEVTRRIITPLEAGEVAKAEIDEDGDYYGFPVDAGTACFVDGGAIATGMPDAKTWHDAVFDNDKPDCWFKRMDDPAHIREGLANIVLPLAKHGENIIIIHSGWGDGFYPVVGGFDAQGRLVRVHIDFMVVFPDDED